MLGYIQNNTVTLYMHSIESIIGECACMTYKDLGVAQSQVALLIPMKSTLCMEMISSQTPFDALYLMVSGSLQLAGQKGYVCGKYPAHIS